MMSNCAGITREANTLGPAVQANIIFAAALDDQATNKGSAASCDEI
jgi:hypothetical protein